MSAPSTLQLPPLALYVHIPWCVQKCPYCDFNSHAQKQAIPEAEYVAAPLEDLSANMADVAGRTARGAMTAGRAPPCTGSTGRGWVVTGCARPWTAGRWSCGGSIPIRRQGGSRSSWRLP